MHIIWLIRRRFPNRAGTLIALLAGVSAAALAVGLGLLLLGAGA